jgi:hypothetical protein
LFDLLAFDVLRPRIIDLFVGLFQPAKGVSLWYQVGFHDVDDLVELVLL